MSSEKPTKKYLELVEPRLDEIKAWARDGVIEEDIAKRLGIAYSTFRDYRDKHSALSQALKKSKEHYDNEVVEALHKNTLGGIVVLKTPFKLKRTIYQDGKKVREEEYIEIADREEYIRPDTMAQIYWLNNRQPNKWKNKPVPSSENENDNQKSTTQAEQLSAALEDRIIEGFNDTESESEENE